MRKNVFAALPFFLLLGTAAAQPQKPVYPKPKSQNLIPFGQKLPAPATLNKYPKDKIEQEKKWGTTPYTTLDENRKVHKVHFPGRIAEEVNGFFPGKGKAVGGGQTNNATSFRLAKDLNPRAESDPSNFHTDVYPSQFAVMNNVSYFYADDGIHGRELWRSDGTAGGTYLVKDINLGEGSSGGFENQITAINGKLYFVASNGASGQQPWTSDGTAAGTYQLAEIGWGGQGSFPNQFVAVGNTVFFVASSYGDAYSKNLLWKTDGTAAGTELVTDLFSKGGYRILEATGVNGLLFFTVSTWSNGRQLWRSDGTDAGTYQVKQIGYYNDDYYTAPMQLTAYNNRLYFSATEGWERRLWTSDGTEAGTGYVPGLNNVLLRTDYIGSYTNFPFPIMNNELYVSGYTYTDGSGLYKYNATTTDGLVLVKDLTPLPEDTYIPPGDMTVVGNKLYLKVISAIGGYHDELWASDGTTVNTQPFKVFEPGTWTYAFVNGYGSLYFIAGQQASGRELWKSNGTNAGTVLVKDIWPGAVSSAPYYLTPVNGKMLMNAADPQKGASLYASDGTEAGTVLVKDINLSTTGSSYAGMDNVGLVPLKNGVFFTAYEREFGREPYFSDGTEKGSFLLQDLRKGENSSHVAQAISRNGAIYFLAYYSDGAGIYKTDGTKGEVQKMLEIPMNTYLASFTATDNGILFYLVFNYQTYTNELWRTDGTPGGTFLLGNNAYTATWASAGNTLFYVAGDYTTGFELWKTDGSVAGTMMVKDINPGWNGSYPYSLFAYNNEVYFGAYDGSSNYLYSFWKSDGTANGTIKLNDITPAWSYGEEDAKRYYAGFKNNVYISATDNNSNSFSGGELYKTDGTPKGTQLVKDINPNPYEGSYPADLTNVDGIIYFTAYDRDHGNELWFTNGTTQTTAMVKDIAPGVESSYLYQLRAAGGKLFFMQYSYQTGEDKLWVSDRGNANDPNHDNTRPVDDPVLNRLTNVRNLKAAGDNIYLTGYSYKYGFELYVANVTQKPSFVTSNVKAGRPALAEVVAPNMTVSPNPSRGNANLYLSSSLQPTHITMTDMNGKVVWQQQTAGQVVTLPMITLPSGVYLVSAKSEGRAKTIRVVKE